MTAPSVLIRQALLEDLEGVLRNQQEWVREDLTHGYQSDTLENLESFLGPLFVVAESSGQLLGHAYGTIHSEAGSAVMAAGTRYLEIDDLYVVREQRAHGIGGLLLDELMRRGRLQGAEHFQVYSSTRDLDRVLRFYREHGFHTWFARLYR
jgi:GNAT superfamily N-acetyltransferase